MHWTRHRLAAVACAIAAGLMALAALAARPPSANAARTSLDVEVAVDTTASMQPSIAQAQADARRLIASVKRLAPAANFAIVQFRDAGDIPEYQVMQPMTADPGAIESALSALSASGGGDSPEALNLVFALSYRASENTIGWRADSKKIVVVISDAEPHGAGAAGFAGCQDTSADPHGLDTAAEFAGMRSAKRTLIMIRQTGANTTASLECYQSLARAAFTGGAAADAGQDLSALLGSLISQAVATRVSFTVASYANNVRNMATYQLGRSRLQGNGHLVLRPNDSVAPGTSHLTDTDHLRDRRYPNHRVVIRVISGSFLDSPGDLQMTDLEGLQTFTVPGPVRVLTLRVRVAESNYTQICPVGTVGVVRIVDASALVPNGNSTQTWDLVEEAFPRNGGPMVAPDGGAACRTHNHGWSNFDNPNTSPTQGGAGGGYWARVSITPQVR